MSDGKADGKLLGDVLGIEDGAMLNDGNALGLMLLGMIDHVVLKNVVFFPFMHLMFDWRFWSGLTF